jgi:hypothetical protein
MTPTVHVMNFDIDEKCSSMLPPHKPVRDRDSIALRCLFGQRC